MSNRSVVEVGCMLVLFVLVIVVSSCGDAPVADPVTSTPHALFKPTTTDSSSGGGGKTIHAYSATIAQASGILEDGSQFDLYVTDPDSSGLIIQVNLWSPMTGYAFYFTDSGTGDLTVEAQGGSGSAEGLLTGWYGSCAVSATFTGAGAMSITKNQTVQTRGGAHTSYSSKTRQAAVEGEICGSPIQVVWYAKLEDYRSRYIY